MRVLKRIYSQTLQKKKKDAAVKVGFIVAKEIVPSLTCFSECACVKQLILKVCEEFTLAITFARLLLFRDSF